VAHKNMESLVQTIVQRQLKNDEKRKKNEIVKEALKEARKNLWEEKRAKNPSATKSTMENRKTSNQKTWRALLRLQKKRRRITQMTQTGIMCNGSTCSRTLTGAKVHHTRLPTVTTIRLDRACRKDVVVAAANAKGAPTEVEEEGADSSK
jgi:N-acetyl-beta-hexosaminidase